MPPGVFYIYALKDPNKQRKYISKDQLIGFADKPVIIGGNQDPVVLYAYLEKDTVKRKPPISVLKQPTKAEKDKEKDKRLKFSMNLTNGQQDLLSKLEFTFERPLKNFDSAKVQFTDENFAPIKDYTIVKDTSNKKLTLSYKWPENTAYNLIVDKDFAEDTAGRKIPRTDTLKFTTMKESDYGNVTIRFNNLDLSKKPVLQILQSGEVKDSVKLVSQDYHVKLFKPGEYEMRILYDTNNNLTWDPGDFFGKHIQPERVIPVKRKLNVKANWDNDNTIDL